MSSEGRTLQKARPNFCRPELQQHATRSHALPVTHRITICSPKHVSKRRIQSGNILCEPPFLDPTTTLFTHTMHKIWVGDEQPQPFRKPRHVADLEDKPVLPIFHKIRPRTNVITDDDGLPCIHCLVHDKPPRFILGWKNKDITKVIIPRQLRLVLKAKETDIGPSHMACTFFEFLPFVTITSEKQMRPGLFASVRRQPEKRLQKVRSAFPSLEF